MKCSPKVGQKCKTFGGAFLMAKKGPAFRKSNPCKKKHPFKGA